MEPLTASAAGVPLAADSNLAIFALTFGEPAPLARGSTLGTFQAFPLSRSYRQTCRMDSGARLFVPRFIDGAFKQNHSSIYSTLLFFTFNGVPNRHRTRLVYGRCY